MMPGSFSFTLGKVRINGIEHQNRIIYFRGDRRASVKKLAQNEPFRFVPKCFSGS
jgi:hypothetical protein